MTSQVTAVPDLSLGAGKEHVTRGFLVVMFAGVRVCADVYERESVAACVRVTVFVYPRISLPLPPAKTVTGECIHRDRWVSKTTCLLQPGP